MHRLQYVRQVLTGLWTKFIEILDKIYSKRQDFTLEIFQPLRSFIILFMVKYVFNVS